jgi:NAD(P)-dependent dehydrogenase (short-subunit alcohol dehydrogenase family)
VVPNGFGDADEIAKLCEELGASHSIADLTDVAATEGMLPDAGGADILVNNAGMTREQVIRNVILERQSSKPAHCRRKSARWRCSCAATWRKILPARITRSMAGGPRSRF